MNNFFNELRRRNVVRVAGVYPVAGWMDNVEDIKKKKATR